MSMEEAFLGPLADDLFESVAAFANAAELESLDIGSGQKNARRSIVKATENAVRQRHGEDSRIALIKGAAGSGKTHVVTNVFRKLASDPVGQFYPVILQLTAPVDPADYEKWLLDASFRELSARHFPNLLSQSPLRRLAGRLLDRANGNEREQFFQLVDDVDDDGEIAIARRIGEMLRREAIALLGNAPSASFFAVSLLAGFNDWSAITFLRHGIVDGRLAALGLTAPQSPHARLEVLRDFAVVAEFVGATIAFAFDQVENTVSLSGEELFVQTLIKVVRIAAQSRNVTVVIVALADTYERVMASQAAIKLEASDRDRIERSPPSAVLLDRGPPDFFEKVVVRRLDILRERARLPKVDDSPEPLPDWLMTRVREAQSVRVALREVALFRERAIELGRVPREPDSEVTVEEGDDAQAADFEKLWADHIDTAPATQLRLLTPTKAALLAWWTREASREHVASEPVEVVLAQRDDAFTTPVIDVKLMSKGDCVEMRRLALCEAPNRNHQLANQVDEFLDACDGGTPAVLRTNGFAKGRTAQVGPALLRLQAMQGLKLDLNDTEWHVLQRANDFWTNHKTASGFLDWRRDRQWLSGLATSLQPLIAPPDLLAGLDGQSLIDPPPGARNSGGGVVAPEQPSRNGPFPVLVGKDEAGREIIWDPYRAAPGQLNNFSVLVTGDSGSGKTQTIKVLIDAACRHDLSLCIFDFKADYCDASFVEPLGIEVVDVRRGLPFNPLRPPPRGASGVQPAEHAYELAGVLARVFRLGPVQEGALRQAINDAYETSGIPPKDWVDPASQTWPTFDRVVSFLRDSGGQAALVTKLSALTELGLFDGGQGPDASFDRFIDSKVCLKLSDLPTDEIKSAIAEIVIIQLHGFALRGDQPRRLKRVLVFDEAHRVSNSARLEGLAREGRAFGVGLVIGTQFPGDVPDELAGNLATQLFLMNNQADHRNVVVRQIHGTTTGNDAHETKQRLQSFAPFDALFTNTHHPKSFCRVIPHYERESPT